MTTSGPTHRRSIHLHLCTRTFGTPIDLPARVQITRNKMSQTRAHSNLREFTAEYHTPQRTRFFDAFHAKPPDQTIFAFVKEHKHQDWCPSQNTLRRWLQQEEESARTPTRRPPAKARGRRPLQDAALEQVETMARGPQELRLRNWQYHSEQAGVSMRTMRRYCKRRVPPVLRTERRWPKPTISLKKKAPMRTDDCHDGRSNLATGQWILHEKGYDDGILMEQQPGTSTHDDDSCQGQVTTTYRHQLIISEQPGILPTNSSVQ